MVGVIALFIIIFYTIYLLFSLLLLYFNMAYTRLCKQTLFNTDFCYIKVSSDVYLCYRKSPARPHCISYEAGTVENNIVLPWYSLALTYGAYEKN